VQNRKNFLKKTKLIINQKIWA